MSDFAVSDIRSWHEFTAFVSRLPGEWAYRGQSRDWPLTTSLERALGNWDVDLSEGPGVERQLIREFRRQYRNLDHTLVESDTLYCIALMQHHGAPTRLLDWTYSPFVAAKFAIEAGAKEAVLWCISTAWSYEATGQIAGCDRTMGRNVDSQRNDSSFLPLYMAEPSSGRHKFVCAENAFHLNDRLIIQQGIFMCPGDVGAAFTDNLKSMDGWNSERNLVKLRLAMDREELAHFVIALRRMNVDSAVLFPGLDGFARSLHERIPLYVDFARRNIGDEDHKTGSPI